MSNYFVSVPYMNLGFALLSGPQLCLNQGTRVKIEISQAARVNVIGLIYVLDNFEYNNFNIHKIN